MLKKQFSQDKEFTRNFKLYNANAISRDLMLRLKWFMYSIELSIQANRFPRVTNSWSIT